LPPWDDGAARREFHFNLMDQDGLIHPIGKPVNDRDLAFAVAKHTAIDVAGTRQEYLGKNSFVSVFDDADFEIHRGGGVDSLDKSG
jgi:hypothetical protein